MVSSYSSGPSLDPWRPGSISNVPFVPFFCLLASLATAGAAVFVVHFANGKEVESWPLSPSVFLSILATLSGILLRSAFQAGADMQWWAMLLSHPGAELRTLHNSWELGHDATARFKFWSKDFLPVLRVAGIVVLLLGANGPLLQRAVFVKLEPAEVLINIDLAIRQEPMWNLTTKLLTHENDIYSPPPYHDEFAKVVNDLNQRRPLELKSDSCPRESTCNTTVTIASFSRVCVKSYTAVKGAPTLPEFQMIYGEKGDPGGDGLLADRSRFSGKGWGTSSVMGYPGAEGDNGGGEVRMRLVVDAAERISPPVKGKTYE